MQALLAKHDFEAAIHERQFGGATEVPVYSGRLPCGIEHRFIDIDSRDLAVRVADLIDPSRDQAWAAGNIQNPLSILAASLSYQIIGPWFLHSVSETHIKCRSVSAELPSAHVISSISRFFIDPIGIFGIAADSASGRATHREG